MFHEYLALWNLIPDGEPVVTPGAYLLPVRSHGEAAMLKIATRPEERLGGALMAWWDGDGAARVVAMDGDAILLERAQGGRSLSALARNDRDDEASRIICDLIGKLHAPRARPLPELVPLSVWFRELEPAVVTHGGILARAAEAARLLLAHPQQVCLLHGDIHHGNILDFGARGWLAIDPKGLRGERGFDYANLFCNPDLGDPSHRIATLPDRFARRLEIVVERSGIDRRRLLQWIIAWTGLSAAWLIGGPQPGGRSSDRRACNRRDRALMRARSCPKLALIHPAATTPAAPWRGGEEQLRPSHRPDARGLVRKTAYAVVDCSRISTRRFCARPAAVSLLARGWFSPRPIACRRAAGTPSRLSSASTAAARRCESDWL